MAWKFADEQLNECGLNTTPFHALHPDETEYDILLFQTRGNIEAGPFGVRQSNNAVAATKLTSFFSLASDIQPALLLTPEYSCPWNALGALIDGEKWPTEGNLWIIGCESITPSELASFEMAHDLFWIHEQPTARMEQRFLTPVCFLFSAYDRTGNLQRVALLQFKQKPMADRVHEIEVKYMIRGSHRAIFRNNDQSIHLAIIICAEALGFNFANELPQSTVLPYLLINLQLNPDPRHSQFREYRDFWSNRRMNRMEILTLNWARGTSVLDLFSFKYGGSGWYFKSSKVDISDDRVDTAHNRGFYYAQCRKRHYDCRILNYDECVLHLKSLKVWQSEAPAAACRDRVGPEVVASYLWDSAHTKWGDKENLDDGFIKSCSVVAANMKPLTDQTLSPTNKERLVCLSSGDIMLQSQTPWPSLASLPSLELTSEEVCQRITFCHDPDIQSQEFRRRRLLAFCTLKNEILSGSVSFPPHLQTLQTRGQIRYPAIKGSFSFNIVESTGDFPATFVFIGDANEDYAKSRLADLADIVGEAKRSLVVWYRNNGQLRYVYPQGLTDLTADLNESARSIVGETHI